MLEHRVAIMLLARMKQQPSTKIPRTYWIDVLRISTSSSEFELAVSLTMLII